MPGAIAPCSAQWRASNSLATDNGQRTTDQYPMFGSDAFIADFRGGVFPHTSLRNGLFFQCLAHPAVSRFGGAPDRLFYGATREDDAVVPYSEGPSVVGLGLRLFF